jgi:glycosyltransferase involved in cell wall biosynthesis
MALACTHPERSCLAGYGVTAARLAQFTAAKFPRVYWRSLSQALGARGARHSELTDGCQTPAHRSRWLLSRHDVHPERVVVLHRAGKQGLGTAYHAGFSYALARGYERVFEMDADFSHDPRALPHLRAALDASDMVLGSPYAPGGATKNWPIWRPLTRPVTSATDRILV